MPPDAKTARGMRGFPTPNDVPPDGGYVVFRLPSNNEWAGLILGAVEALASEYNWYQWGDLTPAEAAERFKDIGNQAPYNFCGCRQPNGSRILRVNSDGHIQELSDDGEWQAPTGDYAIPAVPARAEPTCDERRCAAAANAANVLQQLYEEVADAVAEGADEAEALAVMIGVAVIIIGGWLGLALAALVGLITGGFFAFLEIAEFMTADLWTSDFTEKLKCFLYECASCDGDVVTFDFQCVREKMAGYTDLLDPNFITNLRLFGQVDFILYTIGVDGLNAAGATTAITDATCDECQNAWCYVLYAADSDGGFVPENCGGVMGDWVSGSGWEAEDVGICGGVERTVMNIRFIFDVPIFVDTIDVHYDYEKITAVNTTEGVGLWVDNYANPLFSEDQAVAEEGIDLSINVASGIPQPFGELDFFIQPAFNAHGGVGRLTIVQMTGSGDKPTWLEDYGWVECPPP